ncbi:MAG: hypothetical protein R3B60_03800 [Candidatus Paceibacterota bacterium]
MRQIICRVNNGFHYVLRRGLREDEKVLKRQGVFKDSTENRSLTESETKKVLEVFKNKADLIGRDWLNNPAKRGVIKLVYLLRNGCEVIIRVTNKETKKTEQFSIIFGIRESKLSTFSPTNPINY